jgi:hypothetical protein
MVAANGDRGPEGEKEEQVRLSSSFIKFFQYVIFDGDGLCMCPYFLILVLIVYIFFYSCMIGHVGHF